jgi:hypothetical protein
VIVDSPAYDERMTRNRGIRLVNSKMFDAKSRYREWTDGFGIHCGETLSENLRDAYMLFGPRSDAWEACKLRAWDGSIDVIEQDPMGAHRWRSFDELFAVLNRAVNYALIYYGPPEETINGISSGHSFDILTTDYDAAHSVLHSGPRIPSPLKNGGQVKIRVGSKIVKLNLRFPGDGLFDESWATAILDAREFDSRGFYRAKKDEQYWLIAQNAVTQAAPIDHKYLEQCRSIAADQKMLARSELPASDADLKSLLNKQLADRGIRRSSSDDKLGAAVTLMISACQHRSEMLAARFRTLYFACRDTLLEKYPILCSIKKSIKLLTSRRLLARRTGDLIGNEDRR